MKYMLLIYGDENQLNEQEYRECYEESTQLAFAIKAAGQFVGTSPLQHTSKAKSVRLRDGQRIVTDGPFAETREQLGGFFLVDVPTLEDALAIAERVPMARRGTVEVRPVVELEGLPESSLDDAQGASARLA
jgi:hypothetical protein